VNLGWRISAIDSGLPRGKISRWNCGRFGQQQARLQERQPGRHDEIIGGEFEANFSRGLDENQILIGQRQDRNLGEIDLLLPRQRQQQIERALIALDIDDQRRLAIREFGGPSGFKR
jgi:hypothetical protein